MQIVYKNNNGGQVTMGLRPPFLVTSKKGFGGVENEVTTQKQYGLDGSSLINQQLSERDLEIDFEVIASDKADLEDKKEQISSIFNSKIAGLLTYQKDNGKVYQIDVLVTQPPNFDESSVNLTQSFKVTFLSLDSYWVDKNQDNKLIPLSSMKKNLTFPLRITKGFTFSDISSNTIQSIENKGDVEVGMTITLSFKADVVNPKLLNIDTGEFFRLEATYSQGTVITIVTLRGSKEVTGVLADGTEFNALEDWDEDSVFLQLAQGINFLQLQADNGAENMLGSIKFSPKVVGV